MAEMLMPAPVLCKLQLLVVFMVGGTTYEEARAVADLNTQAR